MDVNETDQNVLVDDKGAIIEKNTSSQKQKPLISYDSMDIDETDPNVLIDDKGFIIETNNFSEKQKPLTPSERRIPAPDYFLKELPVEIRKEWNETFKVLFPVGFFYEELEKLGLGEFIPTMNHGQFGLVFLCLSKWDLALKHLLKEEWLGKKHKPLIKRRIFNKAKPLGNVLIKLLRLAERCHTSSAFLKPNTLFYDTPQKTFSAYVIERKTAEARNILTRPIYNTELAYPNTPIGKTELMREQSTILQALKRKENPYNLDNEYQKKRYRLIEAALQLIKDYEPFERNYWKPYIEAEQAWWQYQKENCQDWWIEVDAEGRFSLCTRPKGKGRGKIKFPFEGNTKAVHKTT
jgi:AraC-like DNA-binding protein